jgi:1,6-anhydro-N-acetylmuramate kinase
VCIYLGVSIPVIGIGAIADVAMLFTAVAIFAALTGGGALAVASWHWRHRDDARADRSPAQEDM